MAADEERCAEARKIMRIDEAFRAGDLDALRTAAGDPGLVPNGPMPAGIGSCLVYAIYHSPLPFVRALLEAGADPNQAADDGFPPLVAALSTDQSRGDTNAGATRRAADLVRLLLSFGADPNQRGINDYTALHMAVAARNPFAIRLLLDAGADPRLATRIDECWTPQEMAAAAGDARVLGVFDRHGPGRARRMRSGLKLLTDIAGDGEPVLRQHVYRIRLRLWLNKGDAVRWPAPSGPVGIAELEEGGRTLLTQVRIDRRSLVSGIFYGIEGMRVGGLRRLEIAPHLAYGAAGVPGVIPPNAALVAEIEVLGSV